MLSYAQSAFAYTTLIKLADMVTTLGVWYASWYLRFHYLPVPKGLPEPDYYSRVALPLVLVNTIVLHIVGAYRSDRIQFGFRASKKVVQGAIFGSLVFVATCYFAEQIHYSRVFLVLFAVCLSVALILERAVLHVFWRRWLKSGTRPLRVLLVGSGDLLEMYVTKIRNRMPYPVQWIGRLSEAQVTVGPGLAPIPYLGKEDRLEGFLFQQAPDQVVVSYPESSAPLYTRILELLSEQLVDVKVIPDFGKYSTFTYSAKDECGIPLLAFNQTPVGNSDRVVKRLMDIVGSAIFLVVCFPLYLAIALAVRWGSRGPIFFAQERVGADGTRFTIYKFRTMRLNAEGATGPVWAVENDPRTTRLGKWLRRTSLDEIPQFWNVLHGEMSLVGPRPERPEFVAQFRKEIPKYMLRHKVKSGITGWAQINGWRGNTSLNERIKHDLYYIGHWSHFLDLKILCLTVVKGFVNRHAY